MQELGRSSGGCDNCAPHKTAVVEFVFRSLTENGMASQKNVPAEWSRRRTRYDPPGLEEAIAAAQGLTDQFESQVEIASQLMGLPEEEVRPRVLMAQAQTRRSRPAPARGRQTEIVVIKRRGSRTS